MYLRLLEMGAVDAELDEDGSSVEVGLGDRTMLGTGVEPDED